MSLRWWAKYHVWRARGMFTSLCENLDRLPVPVFIGATGGSGTRVLARLAQQASVYVGANLNFALDSMDFAPWVTRWLPEYLTEWHPTLSGPDGPACPVNSSVPAGMDRDFSLAVTLLRQRIPDERMPWGAKGPRFVYLIPYLQERFPSMKFIHVVRDGRDMAFAGNQSQLQDYGDMVLGAEWRGRQDPVRSAALWSRVNLDAHDYGTRQLGERYLCIRFEDLCDEPERWVPTVFTFLGGSSATPEAIAEVVKPATTGRWRDQDPALALEVTQACEPGLKHFGYTVP